MRNISAAAVAVALLACSAQGPAEAPEGNSGASEAAAAPSLYGRWRIAEVNGTPARSLTRDPEAQPNVSFAPGTYGGSSGCNGFSGTGLLLDNRWFAEPAMATQQGCGELTEQESAIHRVLAGGPGIALEGSDGAMLRNASGSLRLRRIASAPMGEAAKPPPLLAGTRWEFWALDGKGIELPGARVPVRLTLEADRWSLETPCATRGGPWRQTDGALVLEAGDSRARSCGPALARSSKAVAEALTGRLAYVVGHNGELVLAGNGHWLTGHQDVTFTRGEGHMLSGEWRILSADGVAPPQSERPAALYLGPRGYAVWDGCRHSEGVAIAAERQLFTHGSGMVTMANCPRDAMREKINAVVASSPRIARGASGDIALISRAGTLRLRRASAKPFGTSIEARLRPGTAYDLLIGLGGPARLRLGAGEAFTVTLPCGTFEGRWRNGRGFGTDYARFGPERPPAGCGDGSAAMALYNFFTGNVLAAIGPNGDIALFVNNGRGLPARVANERTPSS